MLFVFYYCHKRGREVRLAKTAAEAEASSESDLEKSTATLDSEILEKSEEELKSTAVEAPDDDAASTATEKLLNQKEPAEVPLPVPEVEGAVEIDPSKADPQPA